MNPERLVPTPKQVDYVQSLQRRLHLPDRMLDAHCTQRFGAPFRGLDRAQVSSLLDEMISWQDSPVELQIAQGQTTLPGMWP